MFGEEETWVERNVKPPVGPFSVERRRERNRDLRWILMLFLCTRRAYHRLGE